MAMEILTKEDLQQFRKQLLQDLKELLGEQKNKPEKKWLKSHEVKKMLKISSGTLQNLRVNGTLRYTRMGRIIFYDAGEIEKAMKNNVQ